MLHKLTNENEIYLCIQSLDKTFGNYLIKLLLNNNKLKENLQHNLNDNIINCYDLFSKGIEILSYILFCRLILLHINYKQLTPLSIINKGKILILTQLTIFKELR